MADIDICVKYGDKIMYGFCTRSFMIDIEVTDSKKSVTYTRQI